MLRTMLQRSSVEHSRRCRVPIPNPENRRMMMNSDTLKGNWEQVKGHVQKKWGELTNDELDQINGSRKILAGKVQEKYGRAQDEVEREIDDFEKTY
ncbi:CsbD family protein [Croceibacterium xixiisoli]